MTRALDRCCDVPGHLGGVVIMDGRCRVATDFRVLLLLAELYVWERRVYGTDVLHDNFV